MKKNILVFPCGSEIGLDIFSSTQYSIHFNIIGGSSVDDHGSFVYRDYISGIPFADKQDFISTLKELVAERKIDAIYPTMDSVITLLKRHESELGCRIVSSPWETTEICLSKSKTYNYLKEAVPVPALLSPQDDLDYPVFVKPDVGYGAKDTAIVYNASQLSSILSSRNDLLVLEYLPGEEYTVDCFTDRHQVLQYAAARKRNRIKSGISVNTYFAEDQNEFHSIAEKINGFLHFRGAWFFQVKRDAKGNLRLLEVASRIGGSSLLSRAKGVNLALMSLYDTFDIDVKPLLNDYDVVMDRALGNRYHCSGLKYDSVYIDYDDCLILENQRVNTELVAFLYQCMNNGKRLILLTKHKGDLNSELRHFRLDTLFDSVIPIDEREEKSHYIDKGDAIFIDDSFSERRKVKENLGIPVFGPEMIDVLI